MEGFLPQGVQFLTAQALSFGRLLRGSGRRMGFFFRSLASGGVCLGGDVSRGHGGGAGLVMAEAAVRLRGEVDGVLHFLGGLEAHGDLRGIRAHEPGRGPVLQHEFRDALPFAAGLAVPAFFLGQADGDERALELLTGGEFRGDSTTAPFVRAFRALEGVAQGAELAGFVQRGDEELRGPGRAPMDDV